MTVVSILYSGLGGHSSVVFSFVEADEKKQYVHVLLFYGIEEMPPFYIKKCIDLGVRYFFVKKKPGLDIDSQKNVIRILNQTEPGIILMHSVNLILPVYSYIIGKKIRLISVEHQPNHLKTKKEWLWSGLLMLLSKKVVYLTDMYAKQMKAHLGLLYSSGKVSIINNGININLFKPSAEKAHAEYSIGMLARMSETKDHITLIEAFRILIKKEKFKNLRLKIAGDGAMKKQAMQKVNESGLSGMIDFSGMIPEIQSPSFLNSLTIYVHASFGETMSTSLMQAMACGKPIIASDVEGINNMIRPGETGILVPVKNKDELALQIEKLLDDPPLRKFLGQNSLQYALENFSNTRMFKHYTDLFV